MIKNKIIPYLLISILSLSFSCFAMEEKNDSNSISTKKNLKQKANQDDAQAQYELGMLYKNGEGGTIKQLPKAIQWFEKAAEQDHTKAQLKLVDIYTDKDTQDYARALKWAKKLVKNNNVEGQYHLGNMYYHGQGVEKNYKEALNWWSKSAEQGNSGSQNNLGWLYQNGQGVSKDVQEAMKWYLKAVEQGSANAKTNIRNLYTDGAIVLKDEKEMVNWFLKAAEQGNSDAQYQLGVMYAVKHQFQLAHDWLEKAAAQGHVAAKKKLVSLILPPQS